MKHNGSNPGASYAWAIQRSNGVDIFVAVNQSNGKSGASFGNLDNLMFDAATSIDWDTVEPYPQINLGP